MKTYGGVEISWTLKNFDIIFGRVRSRSGDCICIVPPNVHGSACWKLKMKIRHCISVQIVHLNIRSVIASRAHISIVPCPILILGFCKVFSLVS